MSPDEISAVIKLRASVLQIANQLEWMDEIKPRYRVRRAIYLADMLKNIVSDPVLVEACKIERTTTP